MRFFSALLFIAFFASTKGVNSQTVYGNYYDAANQAWHLVEIRPTSGDVREVGIVGGPASLLNGYNSFVVDGKKNVVHFFGYDNDSKQRFFTVSLDNAEILSNPEVPEDGWFGLTMNPNDSLLYVMKGAFDSLGTNIMRFTIPEEGVVEHVQHFDLESYGPSAISKYNNFVAQGRSFVTTTTSDGKYYAVNAQIGDSIESFDVLCDYNDPEYIRDFCYSDQDVLIALKQRDVNNNDIYDIVSLDPATGQTELISDLGDYAFSYGKGRIIFESGYYTFIGNYLGDTIQRVFSVDIETGDVVNDPALSLQVQILSIDVDQNSLVGIAETSESKSAIKVFPNPASETIHFEMNEDAEYQVMDVFGKVLIQGNAKTHQRAAVDVSGLAVGVYYLRIENSAASFVIAR